ncbi:hypothetical protein ABFS82_10G126200 [Erythranthe guttata]
MKMAILSACVHQAFICLFSSPPFVITFQLLALYVFTCNSLNRLPAYFCVHVTFICLLARVLHLFALILS